jgi:ribosomal protein S27E
MNIDDLIKAFEKIDPEEFARKFNERMDERKRFMDAECKEGKHTSLKCWNMSGGWIHWKCENCGKLISQRDLPMTI